MIDTPPFKLMRQGALIDMEGTPLYHGVSSFNQMIDFHLHRELGICMFIDGEIQISTADYEKYHKAMLDFVQPGKHILVIGDGDGGFTNRPEYVITQVEPDELATHTAWMYYGANWSSRPGFLLVRKTLAEYVSGAKADGGVRGRYDALFLAITDEFNSDASNFDDVVWLWNHLLTTGGKLVAQVGCVDDPNYQLYLDSYTRLASYLGRHEVADTLTYIDCFHSDHHFLCYTKG